MLIHPYRDGVRVVAGSRVLENPLGLIGKRLVEDRHPGRIWQIENLYAPVRRKIGGIRAKIRDTKDFISFVNQRDLEVLLGDARPGDYCRWLGEEYIGPDDPDWFGLCADDDDLIDDLFDRELSLRAGAPAGILRPGAEITRRVHLSDGIDVEELWALLFDGDQQTGLCPDTRLSTLRQRWVRVQQERVLWKRI